MTGFVTAVFLQPHVEIVYAAPEVMEPREEVMLEVIIDWTEERIIQEIETVFPEVANLAVALAKAEGGLVKERQSDYYHNGKREESYCAFQIHAPSWEKTAIQLGYEDFRDNPAHCIAMARYIYDHTGKNFNQWSAYKNGSYKKHL